jgi:SAM-dependent methyltransferase
MTTRACPVCSTSSDKAKLFLQENIDPKKLSGFSFASRKTPEFMCHRLVQCPTCDLVYADQPPAEEELAHAYHVAEYDSTEEANDAAAAYVRAIRPVLKRLTNRDAALEIGTGTGIFLECLRDEGFTKLVGVEPSTAAIAAAPAHRRSWIREGMFREDNFEPASFDLICCFMTMEHVRDPNTVANAASHLLRPGGAFVTVTHDYHSLVNRLLGKRSPIIDIEHLQLFSNRSLQYMFQHTGFVNFSARAFVNSYSLQYWMRLAPMGGGLKNAAASMLHRMGADKLKLGVNVGNLIAAGFRPA